MHKYVQYDDSFEVKKERYINILLSARNYKPFSINRSEILDMRDRIDRIHSLILSSEDGGKSIIKFMERRSLNNKEKVLSICWNIEKFTPYDREINSIVRKNSTYKTPNFMDNTSLPSKINKVYNRQTSLENMGKSFMDELNKISTGQQKLAEATKQGFKIQGERIIGIEDRLSALEGKNPKEIQNKKRNCRYGNNCTRHNCKFAHLN